MRLVAVGNFYGAHKPYVKMFKDLAVLNIRNTDEALSFKLQPDDVLLFGGGEDISPALYKQKASRYTGSTNELSHRDKVETYFFTEGRKLNLPMIGICRGAQLLCALSGGSLYQHVNQHGTAHDVTTKDGRTILVSSVHHQMMNPLGTKHELIAWSREVRSNVHLVEDEVNIDADIEPEVIFFPDTNALAIQYHPEFMSEIEEGYAYAQELVQTYILLGG